MQSTLKALGETSNIVLQIIATGMHLDRSRGAASHISLMPASLLIASCPGDGAARHRRHMPPSRSGAVSGLAAAFEELQTEVVLVVGDRVEAFAAASAGYIGGRVVAQVHGGDRALGLVDDSLRHAITKLAHVHFPATRQSAKRIARLGEDGWRIHCVGSPGLDGIRKQAAPWREVLDRAPSLGGVRYALLALYPATPDPERERATAQMLVSAARAAGFQRIVIIYPNNDPGSAAIAGVWDALPPSADLIRFRDLPRPIFLGLLRDATLLAGNSSAGIIEAATFGTPVIDLGPRQMGRERSDNVVTVPSNATSLGRAFAKIIGRNSGRKPVVRNVYGGGGAGAKIALKIGTLDLYRHRQKLISY